MAEQDLFTLGQNFGAVLGRIFTPAPAVVIEHKLPGRRRYSCKSIKGHQEICAQIEKMLASYPGVTKARVSPFTGSITVSYSCEERQISELIDALSHLISGRHAIHDKSFIPSFALSAGENLNDSALKLREAASRFLNREEPLFVSRIAGFLLLCYGVSRVMKGERPSGPQLFWWGLALLLRQSHRHPKELISSARQAMHTQASSGRRAG